MTIAEELINEGRAEERARTLRKQLALKFGAIGPELTSRLGEATPDELDRYLERILTADTAAAVFAD